MSRFRSLARRPNNLSIGWPKQVLARAIHQAQTMIHVEGENGDIDLGHDRAQKRGRFEGAETLGAECFA